MRITIERLHKLIHTLKKEEKRYFKLFVSTTKTHKNYLKIFEVLERQEQFDESQYKHATKGLRNKSSLQSYLYQTIVKSLQAQHQSKHVETQILDGIIQVHLFYDRLMFEEAEEVVLDLMDLSDENDVFMFYPVLYQWLFRLKIIQQFKDLSLEAYQDLKSAYRRKIDTNIEYTDLSLLQADFFYAGNSNSRNKEILHQEMEQRLEQYRDSSHPKIKSMAYHIEVALYATQRKIYRSLEVALEGLQYVYTNNLLNKARGLQYTLLVNGCNYARHMPQSYWDRLLPFIQQTDFSKASSRHHFYQFYLPFNVRLRAGDFEKALELEPQLMAHIDSLLISIQQQIKYEIAVTYFMLQRYDECLDRIDLHQPMTKEINNQSSFSLQFAILKALVYYEKEETLVLNSLLKRTRYSLKKENIYFKFEQLFLNFLGKLINVPKNERLPIYKKFYKTLIELEQQANSTEKEVFLYFNYIAWLESKIYNRPFKAFFYIVANNDDVE